MRYLAADNVDGVVYYYAEARDDYDAASWTSVKEHAADDFEEPENYPTDLFASEEEDIAEVAKLSRHLSVGGDRLSLSGFRLVR